MTVLKIHSNKRMSNYSNLSTININNKGKIFSSSINTGTIAE